MTQTDVARKLGRPQSYVCAIKRGSRRVSVFELIELGEALGLTRRLPLGELSRRGRSEPQRYRTSSRPSEQRHRARRRPRRGPRPNFQTTSESRPPELREAWLWGGSVGLLPIFGRLVSRVCQVRRSRTIHPRRLPLLSERGGHPSIFRVHTFMWVEIAEWR
jgi:transcriptional regulator with XRE-family HTH domain